MLLLRTAPQSKKTLGAFPIMTDPVQYRTFVQWQQSPIQGAIPRTSPITPADEKALLEAFTECGERLRAVQEIAQRYPQLAELGAGISDARQSIAEAAAVVIEPETYLE